MTGAQSYERFCVINGVEDNNMKKIVFTNSKNLNNAIIKHLSEHGGDILVFDNFCLDKEIYGYPVISFDELRQNSDKYIVKVTNSSLKSAYELCGQMKAADIEYELIKKNELMVNSLHISGFFEVDGSELKYEWKRSPEIRNIYSKLETQMEGLFRATFNRYQEDFRNKEINVYYYLEDMPQDAYRLSKLLNIDHIFASCTVYPVKETVIPVPNYFVCIDEATYQWPEEAPSLIRDASKDPWSIDKAVWIGDINNSPDDLRRMLYLLGEKHSEQLEIINSTGFWKQSSDSLIKKFIPMTDLPKYKYLIDIRGWSFYARMTRLLQMSRVVLRVESIYREWYDELLIPMKHYVPIKADMSDLLEKIEYLDSRPDVYMEIVEGARSFAEKNLQPESYIGCLRSAILKYGIKTK